MTRIDEETLEVVIEERLSFECQIAPELFDIKIEVKELLEEGNINDDIIDNVKKFLEYNLSKKDKVEILEYIKDDYEYEYESFHPECEVSIFDVDRIRKAINDWIEETFEFRPSDEI